MAYYHLDTDTFEAYAEKIRKLYNLKEEIVNPSDWDWKFVVDMHEKLRAFDRNLQLSPKQMEHIDRIDTAWTAETEQEEIEATDKRFGRFDRR